MNIYEWGYAWQPEFRRRKSTKSRLQTSMSQEWHHRWHITCFWVGEGSRTHCFSMRWNFKGKYKSKWHSVSVRCCAITAGTCPKFTPSSASDDRQPNISNTLLSALLLQIESFFLKAMILSLAWKMSHTWSWIDRFSILKLHIGPGHQRNKLLFKI